MLNNNLKPTNILSQLPSIIILSSLFWLQPAFAETLKVIEGANQVIPSGQTSEDISFRLLDNLGNPLTNGTALLLGLSIPTNSTAKLIIDSTITDKNGEITTYLSETDTLGTYTITALLENDKDVSATTYIFVTDPPQTLPHLEGAKINNQGQLFGTEAKFYGGASIDGKVFKQDVKYYLDSNSSMFVQGLIQVEEAHLGQIADIVVVGIIFKLNQEEIYCMLNESTICEEWDGKPKSLEAFKSSIALPKELSITFSIPLWAGNFEEESTIYGYFGYRLEDVIVFNQQPIEIIVINNNLTTDNN
ncbi:MAG: Ig-like domain-containing protein [Candidatus Marithrix sp.]